MTKPVDAERECVRAARRAVELAPRQVGSRLSLLRVIAFIGLGFCSPGAHLYSQTGGVLPASEPVLQAGDAIKIVVWEHEELSGQFDISSDGRIAHPIYRGIEAAGISLDSVRIRVLGVLRRFDETPQFVAQPMFRVVVSGEVRQPNLYLMPVGTAIAHAIGMAGGPTERAKLGSIVVIRGDHRYILNLARSQEGWGQATVRSGDQIVIPRQVSVFRDYVAPAGSVTAALAAILSLILRK